MTSYKLKFATLAALSVLSAPSLAAWEALPVTGFAVTGTGAGTHQPTGGTTPYRICNPNGNYGSTAPIADSPNCKSPITPTAITQTPETGFTLVRSANRTITMNNALTNNTNKNIGTLQDVVFRKAATNECIFGTQLTLTNVDYYLAAATAPLNSTGVQTFEANGIARGGFAASGTVNVSYAKILTGSETLFRTGRTFTSVQHRAASAVLSNTPAPGYYNLPVTPAVPGILASITGTNATALSVPTLAQQSANLDPNWVEFTTDANANDPDDGALASSPASPAVYVKAACTSVPSATATANAIRLRLTWQEQNIPHPTLGLPNLYPQAFVEVRLPGFVPPGGNANPAPVAGSTF